MNDLFIIDAQRHERRGCSYWVFPPGKSDGCFVLCVQHETPNRAWEEAKDDEYCTEIRFPATRRGWEGAWRIARTLMGCSTSRPAQLDYRDLQCVRSVIVAERLGLSPYQVTQMPNSRPRPRAEKPLPGVIRGLLCAAAAAA